jgi:hypothetical protein
MVLINIMIEHNQDKGQDPQKFSSDLRLILSFGKNSKAV